MPPKEKKPKTVPKRRTLLRRPVIDPGSVSTSVYLWRCASAVGALGAASILLTILQVAQHFDRIQERMLAMVNATDLYKPPKPIVTTEMALKCLQGIPDGPEAFSSPRGRRRRLVFMGDSRIRQIYEATVRKLSDEEDPVRYQDTEKVHHDLRWLPQSNEGDFLADNSSLVEYYWAPEPEKMIQIIFNTFLGEGHRADLLIMGAAIHSLAREQIGNWAQRRDKNLKYYETRLKSLASIAHKLPPSSSLVWMQQPPLNSQNFAREKPHLFNARVDSAAVGRANRVAEKVFDGWAKRSGGGSRVLLWRGYSSNFSPTDDGVHATKQALKDVVEKTILTWLCFPPTAGDDI